MLSGIGDIDELREHGPITLSRGEISWPPNELPTLGIESPREETGDGVTMFNYGSIFRDRESPGLVGYDASTAQRTQSCHRRK